MRPPCFLVKQPRLRSFYNFSRYTSILANANRSICSLDLSSTISCCSHVNASINPMSSEKTFCKCFSTNKKGKSKSPFQRLSSVFAVHTMLVNDSTSKIHIHLTEFHRNVHSTSINYHHKDCWNCGKHTTMHKEKPFFCDCGVVQKASKELDFFELMQLEKKFKIDLTKLGQIFRDTQKKLHPDRFTLKSVAEQHLAAEQSALLNKAYSTLGKPLSRALYMLDLAGLTVTEADNLNDMDFLMEIMETNEEISDINSMDDLKKLSETNEENIKSCVDMISDFFEENKLEDAKNVTMKLRYYTTIQERIKDIEGSNF